MSIKIRKALRDGNKSHNNVEAKNIFDRSIRLKFFFTLINIIGDPEKY
jgi:hypothetical protein